MGLTFKLQNTPCLCIRTLALFKFLYQEVLSPQVNGSPEDGGMAWPHLPVCLMYLCSIFPCPSFTEAGASRPAAHAQDLNKDLRAKSLNPGCKTIKPKLSTF